jgi:hypothetical protein
MQARISFGKSFSVRLKLDAVQVCDGRESICASELARPIAMTRGPRMKSGETLQEGESCRREQGTIGD